MKHFDLYAIGNALVDLEFEVTEEKLKALNVRKGFRTLIDDQRYHQLIDDLEGIKHAKECGGSAANSIITTQLLGANTFYSCQVSNDETGDFFYEELIANGVETNLTADNRPDGFTGKCLAMITPDAERSMCTHLGVAEKLTPAILNEEAIAHSAFVYFEGYLATNPDAKATAIKARDLARQYGNKTAMTLSDPDIVLNFKDDLREMAEGKIDLLFSNEKEALLFCDTDDIEDTKICLQEYANTFAITLGKKGSIVFDGNTFHYAPSTPVTPVDTLGAGDTFAGALIYALTHGYSYKEANRFANLAASQIIAKVGSRINRAEAQAILNAAAEHTATS